jgi:hypothetical protein
MNFGKWTSPEVQPVKGTQFVAKLKDKDEFIFVTMLSEQGWLATPYLKEIDTKYWWYFKTLIDCWYDVRDIGQD